MVRITERKGGAAFSVKVVPRASRNEIGGVEEGILRVRLMAPPVEGAANKALVKLLADLLQVPAREIEIIAGHGGRHKVVCVSGLSPQEVEARLQEYLSSPPR